MWCSVEKCGRTSNILIKLSSKSEDKKPVDVECTSFFNYASSLFSFLIFSSSWNVKRYSGFNIHKYIHFFRELIALNIDFNTQTRGSISKSINICILCCVVRVLRVLSRDFYHRNFRSFLPFLSRFFPFIFSSFFSHLIQFPNSVITLVGWLGFVCSWASPSPSSSLALCWQISSSA